MVRIARAQRITSIADFISARYGKSSRLGALVALIALIGITPYIALQLKAITLSHAVLMHYPAPPVSTPAASFLSDKSFWVALVLAVFIMLFGTRHLDASERHEGMVAAITVESLVKLVAFLSGAFHRFHALRRPCRSIQQGRLPATAAECTAPVKVPGGR